KVFSNTMNPCSGTCFAYKLDGISYEDPNCTTSCAIRLDVADVAVDQSLLSQTVQVQGPNGSPWTSTVTGVHPGTPGQDNYLEVGVVPQGLSTCSRGPAYCGRVAQTTYTENFTLAGGDPDDPVDTIHPFYTLHADFMNGWQQTKLSGLETVCIRNAGCTGGGDIPDNDYADDHQQ